MNCINVPRNFDDLSIQQLRYFAKISFDAYWDMIDRLQQSNSFCSLMQRISNDTIELQKTINKNNQKIIMDG